MKQVQAPDSAARFLLSDWPRSARSVLSPLLTNITFPPRTSRTQSLRRFSTQMNFGNSNPMPYGSQIISSKTPQRQLLPQRVEAKQAKPTPLKPTKLTTSLHKIENWEHEALCSPIWNQNPPRKGVDKSPIGTIEFWRGISNCARQIYHLIYRFLPSAHGRRSYGRSVSSSRCNAAGCSD
jgi:hypothetical protein